MGQSTPTTTMALDEFVVRYAQFRAELAPSEQVWFDELVCRARRHSNAINRRPHMDFERPVMLAMLMEGMREIEATRARLDGTQRQLDRVCMVLVDAGLLTHRPSVASTEQLDRIGQTRLADRQFPPRVATMATKRNEEEPTVWKARV